MIVFLTYIFLLLSFFTTPPVDCISPAEEELFKIINEYRASKKLDKIPMSAKLNKVARAHAWDLAENYKFDPKGKCNPHSWSDEGDWSSCCYTNDHAQPECMWSKPKEIAGYEGSGYEIVFYHSSQARTHQALEAWIKSASHNPVMINQGIWKQVDWNAIGVGIYKNYAVVWFGENKDTTALSYCRD